MKEKIKLFWANADKKTKLLVGGIVAVLVISALTQVV